MDWLGDNTTIISIFILKCAGFRHEKLPGLSTIKSAIFGAEVRLVSLASLQALHLNNWKQTIKIKRKGDKKKPVGSRQPVGY